MLELIHFTLHCEKFSILQDNIVILWIYYRGETYLHTVISFMLFFILFTYYTSFDNNLNYKNFSVKIRLFGKLLSLSVNISLNIHSRWHLNIPWHYIGMEIYGLNGTSSQIHFLDQIDVTIMSWRNLVEAQGDRNLIMKHSAKGHSDKTDSPLVHKAIERKIRLSGHLERDSCIIFTNKQGWIISFVNHGWKSVASRKDYFHAQDLIPVTSGAVCVT